jgi:hypothetical protein
MAARTAPLSLEQLMARDARLRDEPARRLGGDSTGVLIFQGFLLAALIIGGAYLGLARSVRGWETIGLAWLVMNLLNRYRARGWRQLAGAVGFGAVVGLMVAALLSTPSFRLPAVAAPKATQKATRTVARVGCGEFRLSGAWVRCVWDHAGDKANKALSPTTTTLRRKP